MSNTVTPDFASTVNQQVFLAPLGGPRHPSSYLDRFPDKLYNKGVDSRLVKLIYAMIGPAGIGWIKYNYLKARLTFDDLGIDNFAIDKFYGGPFQFGRIIDESYDEDLNQMITREDWIRIQSQDASYRSRAIEFVNAARAGGTPFGVKIAAQSGLGHNARVVENYIYIYNQLSDDPLDIEKVGFTDSTNEFTILPERSIAQNEVQKISITNSPTTGTFRLLFPLGLPNVNETIDIPPTLNALSIQSALEGLDGVGSKNVVVTGGPIPSAPLYVRFTQDLAYQDVPQIVVSQNNLSGGTGESLVLIETTQNGSDQSIEVSNLSDRERYYAKSAVERIKPVNSLITFAQSSGVKSSIPFDVVSSTSEATEVARYVIGQANVEWPARNGVYWIEKGVERRAPAPNASARNHYQGFHNIGKVYSYTEAALTDSNYLTSDDALANYKSEHVGPFDPYQVALIPILNTGFPTDYQYTADQCLADYAEPLTITSVNQGNSTTLIVGGVYPNEYSSIPGVPNVRYQNEQFWSSRERSEGVEYIEIDLTNIQAVNYIYIEVVGKPLNLSVDYDQISIKNKKDWQPAIAQANLPNINQLAYDYETQNHWQKIELHINDSLGGPLITRRLRIGFERRLDADSPFNSATEDIAFSVDVKNIRVGRNVS